MNIWPANHYFFINGWVLRFTDGVTSRANSVFPLNYKGNINTLNKDIALVEKAYHTYGLPSIFTIPEYFEPDNLDVRLLELGYRQLGCITHTMISSVHELKHELINKDFSYLFYSERIDKISEFLAKYSKRDNKAQKVLENLSNRIIIPQKRFIVAEYENKVVGTLMAILDPHGYLYIADVLVDPVVRQQNIATSMFFKIIKEWGVPNGANKTWLQVEIENKEAMNLYSKLGLYKIYSYYYLSKSLETI